MAHFTQEEKDALSYLNRLIDDGMEYPDALYKASRETRIDYESLQELYDSQYD